MVEMARELVKRASHGPLPDHKRVVNNLRYIREQLEKIYHRHNTPRAQTQEEAQRVQMVEAIGALYAGLEELEGGILAQDGQRQQHGLEQLERAALRFQWLEHEIEDLEGVAENTL
jgi:hypothetical protein